MNKPNGMTVIDYQNVHEILMNLDIGEFPGVGKASKLCIIMASTLGKICTTKMNLN